MWLKVMVESIVFKRLRWWQDFYDKALLSRCFLLVSVSFSVLSWSGAWLHFPGTGRNSSTIVFWSHLLLSIRRKLMNTWIKQKKGQVSFMMRVGLGENGAHFLSFLSCIHFMQPVFVFLKWYLSKALNPVLTAVHPQWILLVGTGQLLAQSFYLPWSSPSCRMQIACTISLLWLTWALSPTYHIQSKHCTIGQWTLFWTDMGRA